MVSSSKAVQTSSKNSNKDVSSYQTHCEIIIGVRRTTNKTMTEDDWHHRHVRPNNISINALHRDVIRRKNNLPWSFRLIYYYRPLTAYYSGTWSMTPGKRYCVTDAHIIDNKHRNSHPGRRVSSFQYN